MKVETITAFVSENEGDGILSYCDTSGQWFPLVTANDYNLARMFFIAEYLKKVSGKDYKVLKFTTRADITKEAKEKLLK